MKTKKFQKGIFSASLGSIWWGVLGTYYFQFISFAGTFEVVVHRCIWTSLILLITTLYFDKLNSFYTSKRTLKTVFFSSILKLRGLDNAMWLIYF